MTNLLFVCHGNRYRSPFAAGITKKLRPDWHAESAGVRDPVGSHPAARPARDAAEARGFSLADHRARLVTREMMESAEMVAYMDGGNLRRIWAVFGSEYDGKLVCLASFVGNTRVPDPAFASGEDRLVIWELIARACAALAGSR